jgi:hypothetical protein
MAAMINFFFSASAFFHSIRLARDSGDTLHSLKAFRAFFITSWHDSLKPRAGWVFIHVRVHVRVGFLEVACVACLEKLGEGSDGVLRVCDVNKVAKPQVFFDV